MRVFRLSLLFVLLNLLCWLTPRAAGGTIREEVADIIFQKLEEELYPPIYKQEWFKERRTRKKDK